MHGSLTVRMYCAFLFCVVLPNGGCRKAGGPSGTPPIVQTKTGEMVLVPGGWFEMGSSRGEDDERPPHRVWVDPFLMDRYEVTQKQFGTRMRRNPSRFGGAKSPVECVSWGEAALYCNARSRAESLRPCYDERIGTCDFAADGYRLPTEAEWEYACRAGSDTHYCFGSARLLPRYGWFKGNAHASTHPVGLKKPNPWGIHDMHGNVMEWCNDVYGKDYYAQAPQKHPRGPAEDPKSTFVLRGGAWNRSAHACRSAYRTSEYPGQADACAAHPDIGFRCVRSAPARGEGEE